MPPTISCSVISIAEKRMPIFIAAKPYWRREQRGLKFRGQDDDKGQKVGPYMDKEIQKYFTAISHEKIVRALPYNPEAREKMMHEYDRIMHEHNRMIEASLSICPETIVPEPPPPRGRIAAIQATRVKRAQNG
jgi:hypothetical protein